MAKRTFKGSSLEECLNNASSEMNISLDNLKYKIIEEKKGIFKKAITISVEEELSEDCNGKISVQEGKIIIKDPAEGGKPATIRAGQGVYLVLNGTPLEGTTQVFEKDEISYIFEENESQRLMNIQISEDKLEAYLSIKYVPLAKYKLKDSTFTNSIVIDREIQEEVYPPRYTLKEVKEEMTKLGITFGILEEEIKQYLNNNSSDKVQAAKGVPAVNDTDDFIDYKFQTDSSTAKYDDNNYSRIDYKNRNLIVSVKKGDIIAEKRHGSVGCNGTSILGHVIKKKDGKRKLLKVSNGCELRDENTAVATVDGRPHVKNNILYVNEQYNVQGDLDIKSGNVKFIGDVKIQGNVMIGMEIESGGAVEIEKNVESSKIMAKGDIVIKGNAIMANITAGGNDVINLRRINDLEEFSRQIKLLVDTVAEIKKFNLLGYNKEDGEIIKVLLETKFKYMTKTCVNIIKDSVYNETKDVDRVITLIREMLVGMAPLGIKHYGQLDELISAAKEKAEELRHKLAIPVNINLDYCQDCNISSSGDIIFTGKGQYVSHITAHNAIIFANDKSVARGGELFAGNEIRCSTVGSSGGVATKLSVEDKGHIWVNTAHQNTKLVVGGREFILDVAYKNIHAYIDNKGDLIVEKLKL